MICNTWPIGEGFSRILHGVSGMRLAPAFRCALSRLGRISFPDVSFLNATALRSSSPSAISRLRWFRFFVLVHRLELGLSAGAVVSCLRFCSSASYIGQACKLAMFYEERSKRRGKFDAGGVFLPSLECDARLRGGEIRRADRPGAHVYPDLADRNGHVRRHWGPPSAGRRNSGDILRIDSLGIYSSNKGSQFRDPLYAI